MKPAKNDYVIKNIKLKEILLKILCRLKGFLIKLIV